MLGNIISAIGYRGAFDCENDIWLTWFKAIPLTNYDFQGSLVVSSWSNLPRCGERMLFLDACHLCMTPSMRVFGRFSPAFPSSKFQLSTFRSLYLPNKTLVVGGRSDIFDIYYYILLYIYMYNIYLIYLTGWWFQPLWNILVRLDHHPNYWGNKKCSKPPTSNILEYTWCICDISHTPLEI